MLPENISALVKTMHVTPSALSSPSRLHSLLAVPFEQQNPFIQFSIRDSVWANLLNFCLLLIRASWLICQSLLSLLPP